MLDLFFPSLYFDAIKAVLVETLLNEACEFALRPLPLIDIGLPMVEHVLPPIYVIIVQFYKRHLLDHVLDLRTVVLLLFFDLLELFSAHFSNLLSLATDFVDYVLFLHLALLDLLELHQSGLSFDHGKAKAPGPEGTIDGIHLHAFNHLVLYLLPVSLVLVHLFAPGRERDGLSVQCESVHGLCQGFATQAYELLLQGSKLGRLLVSDRL